MNIGEITCVIFGEKEFDSEILWKMSSKYLCDKLSGAGVKKFVQPDGLEDKSEDMVLSLRADAVPKNMESIMSAVQNFDGEPITLCIAAEKAVGYIAIAKEIGQLIDSGTVSNHRVDVNCVGGFLTEASEYERFELTKRINREKIMCLMNSGVRFRSLDGILVCPDAEIGAGCEILPGTMIKSNVKIGCGCVIGANSVIEDSVIGDDCLINASQIYSSVIGDNVKIGPFSHIRPNCTVCSGVKIGDFVELKNSVIGERTSVAHLTYVGDSDVGSKVNFGCGCVTVNYDGKVKSRTKIGDNVFVGCNTNLVAPVVVEDGSYIAAGSTITDTVPEDSLAIARARQVVKPDWARQRREKSE